MHVYYKKGDVYMALFHLVRGTGRKKHKGNAMHCNGFVRKTRVTPWESANNEVSCTAEQVQPHTTLPVQQPHYTNWTLVVGGRTVHSSV